MRPPTVTFYGGVREIGGNKILVEDGSDRILFDFGPSFDPLYEQYYLNFLQPRSTSPVRDLLEFHLLPWIDGLYAREALGGIEERYREPEIDAVFLSHAHTDHTGYLEYIDPLIPVYAGEGTQRVIEAHDATTPSAKYGTHPWSSFGAGRSVHVGPFEVQPFPVDHSVPYAFGFLVRTREGSFAYTGDFRHHGPRAALTHDFLSAAAAEKPSALLIEGTRAGPDRRKQFTEETVRSEMERLCASTVGPVIAACYPRDTDRLRSLHAAARASGRTLVVPPKTAYLFDALGSDAGLALPRPGHDANLAVYRRSKKTSFKWERPYLDTALDASDVRRRGKEIVLLLDLLQFAELIDLRPPAGTPFVRSMSEPFSEEDVDEEVFQNWLRHFDLRLHQLHASGHCSSAELLDACRTVGATNVFPIHTEHPEGFDSAPGRVVPPEKGVSYRLETGRAEK